MNNAFVVYMLFLVLASFLYAPFSYACNLSGDTETVCYGFHYYTGLYAVVDSSGNVEIRGTYDSEDSYVCLAGNSNFIDASCGTPIFRNAVAGRFYYSVFCNCNSSEPDLCSNGIKDDNEDDIDCGGPCLPCPIAPKDFPRDKCGLGLN